MKRVSTVGPYVDLAILLAATVCVVALAYSAYHFQEDDAHRALAIVALPFASVGPGYGLLAMLFPHPRDLELVERLGLSSVVSVALLTLLVFALNHTSWGVRLVPMMVGLSAVTAISGSLGLLRRLLPKKVLLFAALDEIAEGGRDQSLLALCLCASLALAGAFAVTVFISDRY